MLLSCPKCGFAFPSGHLRPETGTALCELHGEVRPHVIRPALGRTTSPAGDWSSTWSSRESSYEYEAILHKSLGAVFAPFPWQGGVGFVTGEAAELLLILPLLAATYIPRLLSPRLHINAQRVRFGVRSQRLKNVGRFVVIEKRAGTELGTSAQQLVMFDCRRPPDERGALCALRDELNEALFVVRYQTPLPEMGTPYRG